MATSTRSSLMDALAQPCARTRRDGPVTSAEARKPLWPRGGPTVDMSESVPPRSNYSEAEAALALRRAASLQLEAAERAERRSALGPPPEADGYERDDLLAAAREVGIDPAFVNVALAELSPGTAPALFDAQTDRAATRWLGTRARSVSASRRFTTPADELWPQLVRVCEGNDFGLRLAGTDGGHPLAGGVARFQMMRLGEMVTQRGSYTMLCYRMEQLDVSDLRVVLRTTDDATDVTIFGDLRAGVGRNLWWARMSSGVFGALAGAGALAAGVAAGPVLAGFLLVAGGLAGAGTSLGGWRWMYRSAATHMGMQLERVLDEIGRTLQRETLMRSVAGSPPSAGTGDDGSGLRIVVAPR